MVKYTITEKNKVLYYHYIDEFWSKGSLTVANEVPAPNCIIHEPIPTVSWTPRTVDELKERAELIRTGIYKRRKMAEFVLDSMLRPHSIVKLCFYIALILTK